MPTPKGRCILKISECSLHFEYLCSICHRNGKIPEKYEPNTEKDCTYHGGKKTIWAHLKKYHGISVNSSKYWKADIPKKPVPPKEPKVKLNLKCPVCDKIFAFHETFEDHMVIYHAISRPYKCPENRCNKSYAKKQRLDKHIKKEHPEEVKPTFPCPECHMVFDNQREWQLHYNEHGTKQAKAAKMFKCNQCGMEFRKKSQMRSHRATKHYRKKNRKKPIKKWECDLCGKKYTRKIYLEQHRLLHSGEKPFQCEKCGKMFASKSNRNQHQRHYCHNWRFPAFKEGELKSNKGDGKQLEEMEEEKDEMEVCEEEGVVEVPELDVVMEEPKSKKLKVQKQEPKGETAVNVQKEELDHVDGESTFDFEIPPALDSMLIPDPEPKAVEDKDNATDPRAFFNCTKGYYSNKPSEDSEPRPSEPRPSEPREVNNRRFYFDINGTKRYGYHEEGIRGPHFTPLNYTDIHGRKIYQYDGTSASKVNDRFLFS